MNNTTKIVAAVAVGALAGAALALLFAPAKGSETRKKMKAEGEKLAGDLKEEGAKLVNALKEEGEKLAEAMKEKIRNATSPKDYAEKSTKDFV